VGLLLYSKQARQAKAEASQSKFGITSAFDRMRAWFQGNF
jgi:hypothetical protein